MIAASSDTTDNLKQLAALVVSAARDKGISLGTAESCTGGLVAAMITAVPGASEVFEGAIVSYSNSVKVQCLSVSDSTLIEYGAVSEQTAREMACGARKALAVDIAVSVTGVAGPGGSSDEKPLGTVWLCVAEEKMISTKLEHFDGDRESVRHCTVRSALNMLLERLRVNPSC